MSGQVVTVTGKTCTKCAGFFPLDEFYSIGNGRRRSYCCRCEIEMVRAYAARKRQEIGDEAYRERQAAIARKHRSNPDNREKQRAHVRARGRALERLAEMYPEDFERLKASERVVEGLAP